MTDQQLIDFCNQQYLATLSYLHANGQPGAAVVGMVMHDDFSVTFGTETTTRKYTDILENSFVALVIGWSAEKRQTLQYEGRARLLEGAEWETYRQKHIAIQPDSAKYTVLPQERMFLIEPVWLRYRDYSQKPMVEIERLFN